MKPPFNLDVYLVTDAPERCRYGLLETVRRAVEGGGVSMVQYRSGHTNRADLLAEAIPLHQYLRGVGIPLIINNDILLALELNAEGVHIGQRDTPVADARRYLGPDKILGLTVANEAEMAAVDASLVDYVGCGPVFPTISKDDAPPALGIARWNAMAASCPVPICAIGGLDAARAKELRAGGHCDGIAVVSAICAAENPAAAARELSARP
ncbi:MAG: thiamine phosphate synthase [Akkermansia sp.]|nr:thiamine phosphate synthase [Akkermansia sp.]